MLITNLIDVVEDDKIWINPITNTAYKINKSNKKANIISGPFDSETTQVFVAIGF